MSEIKITDLQDLRPAGADFFTEDEGYLENLNEDEMNVWGGRTNVVVSVDNKNGFVSIDNDGVISISNK